MRGGAFHIAATRNEKRDYMESLERRQADERRRRLDHTADAERRRALADVDLDELHHQLESDGFASGHPPSDQGGDLTPLPVYPPHARPPPPSSSASSRAAPPAAAVAAAAPTGQREVGVRFSASSKPAAATRDDEVPPALNAAELSALRERDAQRKRRERARHRKYRRHGSHRQESNRRKRRRRRRRLVTVTYEEFAEQHDLADGSVNREYAALVWRALHQRWELPCVCLSMLQPHLVGLAFAVVVVWVWVWTTRSVFHLRVFLSPSRYSKAALTLQKWFRRKMRAALILSNIMEDEQRQRGRKKIREILIYFVFLVCFSAVYVWQSEDQGTPS